MRWRSVSRTACSLAGAALLAGCGGPGQRLPVLTTLRLSQLAGDVAAGKNCGRPLLAAVVAAVNRHEVPPSLLEPLTSAANRIAATCSRREARALIERLAP
ncbi:MAG TPA: hypothetical protein VFA66_12390 [Gaiellaceae bacterium]|nr:hypothetical protein [Gaiellaceae bacterium]